VNRRTFLRSLTTVCGAVVVCPGELLKTVQPTLRFWPMQKIIVSKWPKYDKSYILNDKTMPFLVKEFEKAFWNTKFKSPLMDKIK